MRQFTVCSTNVHINEATRSHTGQPDSLPDRQNDIRCVRHKTEEFQISSNSTKRDRLMIIISGCWMYFGSEERKAEDNSRSSSTSRNPEQVKEPEPLAGEDHEAGGLFCSTQEEDKQACSQADILGMLKTL